MNTSKIDSNLNTEDRSKSQTNDTTNKIFSFLPTDEFTSALQNDTTRWHDISEAKVTPQNDVSFKPDSLKLNSILRMADILNQHVLLHPFISLRRTCQVNRKCSPLLCVQPFSLIPFLYHQQRNQGISALYKGLSSELLVKGITLGTETAIANYAEWPTSARPNNYIEDSFKLITLKAISVALSTPFICSSVIETVQSINNDRPSFIDCLKDCLKRIIHTRSTSSARMLPIWLLVVPTVFYHVSHFAITHLAKYFVNFFKYNLMCGSKSSRRLKSQQRWTRNSRYLVMDDTKDSLQQDLTLNYDTTDISIDIDDIFEEDSSQISTSIMSSFIADVALLPIETVLNSLFIQGTRTFVCNCDETTVVLPALTNFDGFNDCYQSIIKYEGTLGLYKGLGAIFLQYSFHFLLFRSLYYLLKECHSDKRGNAHQKSVTRIERYKGPAADPDFMQNAQNIRHSTPNNPNLFKNRYIDKEFDIYGSPSTLGQL